MKNARPPQLMPRMIPSAKIDAIYTYEVGPGTHTKPHPLPYTYKYGVAYICKILNDFDWFFLMWPAMASFKAGVMASW